MSKTVFEYRLGDFTAIESHEDVDGHDKHIVLTQNRQDEQVIRFRMTAAKARQVARKLTQHANFIDPPQKRKQKRPTTGRNT